MQKLILIADDDQDDGDLLFEAIGEYNKDFRCLAFASAERLLQFLDVYIKKPDIIFLDINMPRVNGFECLTRLKSDFRLASIPVVMISTSKSLGDREKAYEEGAFYFLTKPATYSLWRTEIANILKLAFSSSLDIHQCS